MGLDQEIEIRYEDDFSKRIVFNNERELHDIIKDILGRTIINEEIIVFPRGKLFEFNLKLKNYIRSDPWYLSKEIQKLFCYLQLLNLDELKEIKFCYYSSW